MQAIARDCYRVLSQEAGEAAADLSSARRLLSTASEPLVALGKHLSGVLLQSLGSTTAFALTGSVGVVRLGVGKLFMLVPPARSPASDSSTCCRLSVQPRILPSGAFSS